MSLPMVDALRRDLRDATRSLRRSPGFTITAVGILGLGIGMATAMFATFNAVILRPLPVHEQSRIILPHTLTRGQDFGMSIPEVGELDRTSRTMSGIAGVWHGGTVAFPLNDGDRWIWLNQAVVTGNFFDVLGVRPVLGRLLQPEDDVPGREQVIVISYDLWQREFSGSPGVIDHALVLPFNNSRYRIVGVAPPGLNFPATTGYWICNLITEQRNSDDYDAVARLAPGVTPNQAQAEFWSMMQRVDRDRVWRKQFPGLPLIDGTEIKSFEQAVLGEVRPASRVLVAAVALLLIIACVNVGNLLLLRITSRTQEVAIRRSLGAQRGDVLRVQLIEAGALSLAAGVLGLLCAWGLIRSLLLLAPVELAQLDVIRTAGVPVGLATATTAFAAMLIGLLPLIANGKVNDNPPLRADSRSGRESRGRKHVRQGLVGSQIALAVMMLAAASLLARSLEKLYRLNLGYTVDKLSVLSVVLPITPENGDEKLAALYDAALPRIGALRGVRAVTPIGFPPFTVPQVHSARFEIEGQTPEQIEHNPPLPLEIAGAGYFTTFDIPLVRGRGFLDSDRRNSQLIAVVSEAAAKRFWPGRNPIGQRIRMAGDTSSKSWLTVVGVAGDIHLRDLRQSIPTVYLPWRQLWSGLRLLAVRTTEPVGAILPAMRKVVHEIDPSADIARAQTMDELVTTQRALPRLSTLLLSTFGMVALTLAAIGLYGIMAFSVRERTREIGVRSALGATPNAIRSMILGQALTVAAAGAVAGVLGAIAGSRFLAAMLFEISPTDPVTLVGVTVLLVLVAALAAYLPARRATKIDPARALRAE